MLLYILFSTLNIGLGYALAVWLGWAKMPNLPALRRKAKESAEDHASASHAAVSHGHAAH